jgi:hypothetical protein
MNILADGYRQEAAQLRRLASNSRENWERELFTRVARVCESQAERAGQNKQPAGRARAASANSAA